MAFQSFVSLILSTTTILYLFTRNLLAIKTNGQSRIETKPAPMTIVLLNLVRGTKGILKSVVHVEARAELVRILSPKL